MIKKNLNVEEATELELKFEDKTINLAFNTRALSYLIDSKVGGLKGFLKQNSVAEFCAKIIYITSKAAGNPLTLDEARKITGELKPVTASAIIDEFYNCLGYTEDDKKKLVMETLQQIVK